MRRGQEHAQRPARSSVIFREFGADEYVRPEAVRETAPEEFDLPEIPELNDREIEARLKARREQMTDSVSGKDSAPMSEMLGLFASAVNKMSEAIDNLGSERSSGETPGYSQGEELRRNEALQSMEARLQAQNEELRRLQAENESLRAEAEEQPAYDDEEEESWESSESRDELDLEAYSEESDDPLDLLFEKDEDTELDLDDFLSFDDESFEIPEEDEEALEDEEPDLEEDDDAAEDAEEGEDDVLSSFYSFANQLKTMTVFEKMRFDGRTVEPISVETLESLVQAQKERRRKERLNPTEYHE